MNPTGFPARVFSLTPQELAYLGRPPGVEGLVIEYLPEIHPSTSDSSLGREEADTTQAAEEKGIKNNAETNFTVNSATVSTEEPPVNTQSSSNSFDGIFI